MNRLEGSGQWALGIGKEFAWRLLYVCGAQEW
jgi:hypothetical protein